MRLAEIYPAHGGIVMAQQRDWTLPALIAALDHLLVDAQAEEWLGQVRWLNDWRR